MATFAYSGRTRQGQTVSGERMAETMDGAVAALRREQILVTQISPVKEAAAKAAPKPGGKKVKSKSLAVFTRQFSVMIDAGLPLVQCLEILGTQEEDKGFSSVILATRGDVEGGAVLAIAVARPVVRRGSPRTPEDDHPDREEPDGEAQRRAVHAIA